MRARCSRSADAIADFEESTRVRVLARRCDNTVDARSRRIDSVIAISLR
jgi:hypothetical protein